MGHGHILACQWSGTERYMTTVDEFGIMLSQAKVCIFSKQNEYEFSIYTTIKLYSSTRPK